MQKENIGCYKKSMSCREVVTRHLRIFVSDGVINGRKEIRRSRIKSGMTPLFNNNAFTLIELLVVVLIVGILAAVALPQYEKSVMKSRYATMMNIVNSIAQAEEVYYLANGTYSQSFEELAIEPSGCTLSADKTACAYFWGHCVLNTEYGRIACINTQNLKNAYIQFFPHGPTASYGRTCWSISTTKDDKYGKLCESMGAVYEGKHDLIGVSNGIYMYKF